MMTEKVKDMFKEAFKEAGITWDKIHIGSFVDVGLECYIPLTWVFDTSMEKFDDLVVDSCIFDVLDALGMDEIYDDRFDMIFTTNDTETFLKDTTEEL